MSVTVPGLNPTTEDDQQATGERISSNSLNVTRVGGIVAVISAIAAAVAPIFPISAGEPLALQVTYGAARAIIIATALVVTAIIISADIAARAQVSAVAKQSARVSDGASAGATVDGHIAASGNFVPSGMIGLPQPLRVRVVGSGVGMAIALRSRRPDHLEYLVAHGGDRPTWVLEAGVEVPAPNQTS